MFSDTFYKADKYNLNTFEYVSTYERMPWRFTSLVDGKYLPNLSPTVSAKLNRLFQYRYPHNTEVLHDSNKIVSIEYVGEEIKAFFLTNPMKYATVSTIPQIWSGFAKFAGIDHLCDCKSKIDKMTDLTDINETEIVGIHYDKDGNYTGIRIFDPTYNLAEYSSNETLNHINSFVKNKTKNLKGVINIFHDSDLLTYTLMIDMPQVVLMQQPNDNLTEECHVAEGRRVAINKLESLGYISTEQKEFISSVCTGRSTFNIDYVVSENGELVEMYLRHLKVLNFEDLTTD